MNEITLTKKDKLLKDGYKLIFPNNLGLTVNVKSRNTDYVNIVFKYNIGFDGLGFIEGYKNRNNLFLSYNIHKAIRHIKERGFSLLQLIFKDKNKTTSNVMDIASVELLNEKGEEFLVLGKPWTKRIKEIYLNSEKSSLAIVIDENFQWPEERKLQLKAEEQKKKKETLDNKVNLLLE